MAKQHSCLKRRYQMYYTRSVSEITFIRYAQSQNVKKKNLGARKLKGINRIATID